MNKKPIKIALLSMLLALFIAVLAACSYQTYQVTFVLGDGRDDVVAEVNPTAGLYTPEAPEGKVFAGWFTDPELKHPFLKRVSADMTLYARFLDKGEYVVTFVYGNGMADTTLVISGTITEPADPVREGYVFMGWEDASTGLKYCFGEAPKDAHTVLVATWRAMLGGVSLTAYPENGSDPTTYKVAYGSSPTRPEAPTREGYAFLGWYADKGCASPYDFSAPILRDTVIYAGWTKDIAALGNEIATKILAATVEVNTVRTASSFPFGTTGGYTSIGSGVIFNYKSGYYYLLTNAHVVSEDDEYPDIEYKVYDAYGNEYRAMLACPPSVSYDLAVLKFEKGSRELAVAELGSRNIAAGSTVISVGSPDSLNNSVTYGECVRYQVANVTGGSVEFEAGWHNTPVSSGSSGGAVFDLSLNVIGINFAATSDDDGNFKYGAFIPISRVREYLSANSMF